MVVAFIYWNWVGFNVSTIALTFQGDNGNRQ